MIMGTIGVEMFCGSVCVALSQNGWIQVVGSCGNGDDKGYDSWEMEMIIHACS